MKKTVKTIVKLLGSALCALLFAVNAVPGMDMVLEQLLTRGILHHLTHVHHHDIMADMTHHA